MKTIATRLVSRLAEAGHIARHAPDTDELVLEVAAARVVIPEEVYGPELGWHGLVPRLAVQLTRLRTEAESAPPVKVRLPLPGEPSTRRALVHFDDALAALTLVATRGVPGERYELGGLEDASHAELARRMAALLYIDVDPEAGARAIAPASTRRADGRKLAALGYTPRVTLDAGLAPTVEWYSAHVHRAPADLP
jgi:nucleoside-diphosphate-sugar epimerase